MLCISGKNLIRVIFDRPEMSYMTELKFISPVILTGNHVAVIFSPEYYTYQYTEDYWSSLISQVLF